MHAETWVHHFDPETKRQSMVWKHAGSSTLRNSRSPHLLGKSGYCFWASEGVIMTGYLSKVSTVTYAYYADELHQLHAALKSKHRGKL